MIPPERPARPRNSPCAAIPLRIVAWLSLASLLASGSSARADTRDLAYPPTPRIPVADTLHGTVIVDEYRWLERGDDPAVQRWVAEQVALTRSLVDSLPQRSYLVRRYTELKRYDDESVPQRALIGERLFFERRLKHEEKWVSMTRAHDDAPAEALIDPNTWTSEETLAGCAPSRDGTYLAFGKARGGDENPVIAIMDVSTRRILPDRLRGWKQHVNAWLPDNTGFYYSAKPLAGEVPEGEEDYWPAVYLHKLGTPPEQDRKVFHHETVKEYWHGAAISEDGRYLILTRSLFNAGEVYYRLLDSEEPLTPLATGFDAEYTAHFIGDKILIHTDRDAPRYMVYVTDADHPQREHWRVFIPEHPTDLLSGIKPIAGHIYASYNHNAYRQIRIHDRDGVHLRDLPLPALGNAWVSGHWSRDDVWVSFSSFTYPETSYRYDFATDRLAVYRRYPVEIDVGRYVAEQVWFESKDGTPVSMFLVHDPSLDRNGTNPTLLSGYGGFNISMRPYFNTHVIPWLEAGGVYALPNLRGGGEYGREWHRAGMREKKQNVFDDFIAAAEWLIANGYTRPEKLVIVGRSNGGLLVGAATVQRPELFRAVECGVPLLDMVRYHRFGLANIWAEEYGSAADPGQFAYLLAYSPYQNVEDGVAYPAVLITSGENDARVDPLHARKMVARLQQANPHGEPVLLLEQGASGHGGGTTLSVKIAQSADAMAFLMWMVDLEAHAGRAP